MTDRGRVVCCVTDRGSAVCMTDRRGSAVCERGSAVCCVTDRGSAVCDRGSAVQSAGGCSDAGVGHQPRAGGATRHTGQTSRPIPGPAPPAAAGCHPGPFPGGRAQSGSTSGFLAAKVRALHLVSHLLHFLFSSSFAFIAGSVVRMVLLSSFLLLKEALMGWFLLQQWSDCMKAACVKSFQTRQKAKIRTQVAKIQLQSIEIGKCKQKIIK